MAIIRNLTPTPISMVNEFGDVIAVLPSEGIARDARTIGTVDAIIGNVLIAPVRHRVYGLPEPKAEVWYIVSLEVVAAAWANGRTTKDLLVPALKAYNKAGGLVGYRLLVTV